MSYIRSATLWSAVTAARDELEKSKSHTAALALQRALRAATKASNEMRRTFYVVE